MINNNNKARVHLQKKCILNTVSGDGKEIEIMSAELVIVYKTKNK